VHPGPLAGLGLGRRILPTLALDLARTAARPRGSSRLGADEKHIRTQSTIWDKGNPTQLLVLWVYQ
jgi:hypothetical protein